MSDRFFVGLFCGNVALSAKFLSGAARTASGDRIHLLDLGNQETNR
ncbi:MAG TPA: hypothetical protein VKV96_05250 [Roseiarcus sp.]|nr:hypothetical protein [Roseiarcus sp.]